MTDHTPGLNFIAHKIGAYNVSHLLSRVGSERDARLVEERGCMKLFFKP